MLNHSAVEANIPAADLDRVREYYSDKLGLSPIAEYGDQALRYQTANGTFFNVYKTQYAGQGSAHDRPVARRRRRSRGEGPARQGRRL
jgi:catechol 2,3-dioxygenase-like lactoylglutathione lyase family enzyme